MVSKADLVEPTAGGMISLFDKETVDMTLYFDSISVGDGGTPHNPTAGVQTCGLLGRMQGIRHGTGESKILQVNEVNQFPRTPGIKCIEALFNSQVCNEGSSPTDRKDGPCETGCVSCDKPCVTEIPRGFFH